MHVLLEPPCVVHSCVQFKCAVHILAVYCHLIPVITLQCETQCVIVIAAGDMLIYQLFGFGYNGIVI